MEATNSCSWQPPCTTSQARCPCTVSWTKCTSTNGSTQSSNYWTGQSHLWPYMEVMNAQPVQLVLPTDKVVFWDLRMYLHRKQCTLSLLYKQIGICVYIGQYIYTSSNNWHHIFLFRLFVVYNKHYNFELIPIHTTTIKGYYNRSLVEYVFPCTIYIQCHVYNFSYIMAILINTTLSDQTSQQWIPQTTQITNRKAKAYRQSRHQTKRTLICTPWKIFQDINAGCVRSTYLFTFFQNRACIHTYHIRTFREVMFSNEDNSLWRFPCLLTLR